MIYADITGWGKCLPPAILSNQDLSSFLDTTDEWISTRTGIKNRRISHVETSDLATQAARQALACADLKSTELDAIILATASPDTLVPSAASKVQLNLGASSAAVFDMNAACTGFLYALSVGSALIQSGQMNNVLVIGAEKLSHYMDWSKRDTAVLFGDGAGAVVMQGSQASAGLIASKLGCDPEGRNLLAVPDSGTARERFSGVDGYYHFLFDGQEIFKRAVAGMAFAAEQALKQASLSTSDIDLFVPHQANLRIIDFLAKKMRVAKKQVMVNIEHYGNTSAATVPIALCEALEQNKIAAGQHVLLAAFGAGLTWGAGIVKWGKRTTPLNTTSAQLPECQKSAIELISKEIAGCQQAV